MFQAELRRALRLVLGELAEIIVKAVHGTAIKTRPERRFADGFAAGERHALVIIRRAADHVGVRFNVTHNHSAADFPSRKQIIIFSSEFIGETKNLI
jgi:hypothetical protein